jgi:hypothetical protein
MHPGGVYQSSPIAGDDTFSNLASTAKGWHSMQMGVLGFIGLCGVLQSGDSGIPSWLESLTSLLAGAAFVVACVAMVLVGRVAYPFYGATAAGQADQARVSRMGTQLKVGIRTSFVAVVLIVVSALSGWWPGGGADAGSVQVRDAAGRTWCGPLTDAPTGSVGVRTADGPVAIRMDAIAEISPVGSC